MRKVNKIIIHCSATQPSMDIGKKEINTWHCQNGYNGIGYHEVIRRDGTREQGREYNVVGAHTYGQNKFSLGICLVGGVDANNKTENNFTDAQFETLKEILRVQKKLYPDATIHGHREFANKDCPCFDVQVWVKENLAQVSF